MVKYFYLLATVAIFSTFHEVLGGDYAATQPCSAATFVRVEGCCDMPKLISKEDYIACVPGSEQRAKDGLLNAYRAFGGVRGGPGGPMCLVQCMLDNQKLLTSSGDADVDKISKKMENAANDVWKPLVKAAMKDCANKVARIDNGQLPTQVSDGKICKPNPALFSTCVKHQLAMKCPAEYLNKNDEACPSKMEKLSTCDPLAMRNSEFLMLRAHKLRKNVKSKKSRGGANAKSTTPLHVPLG